jgi:hypothetical protein
MSSIHPLKVPTFDLNWIECNGSDGNFNFLLLPGGGGSTKSGVKNQIIVAQYHDEKDPSTVELKDSFLTDTATRSSLCSGISVGNLKVILTNNVNEKSLSSILSGE